MSKINSLESNGIDIITIKKLPLYFILFLSIFSNSVLRTEENLVLYFGVSVVISLFVYFQVITKPSRIGKALVNSFTTWLVILFSMYFLYGIVLTKYADFNAQYFLFILIMTFFTLILLVDVPKKSMIEIFINICALTSIGVSLYILINEWSVLLAGGTRLGSSGSGNEITVSNYLGIMSIPSLYKIIFEKRFMYIVPYGLSSIMMLLSGSKQSMLLIITVFLILFIFKYGFKLYKYYIPILLIVLLFYSTFSIEYLYNIMGVRIADFFNTFGFNIEGAGTSNSTSTRLLMLEQGFQAFISKPLFGGGWYYFSVYSGLGTYSHNNYLELLATYGTVGFLIYYSMFLTILVRLVKLVKVDDHAKMLLTILISILLIDTTAITFSIYVLNYQVLVVGYLFVRAKHA